MRRIDDAERRTRLGRRHGLAGRLATVDEAAEAMVVLHATDPATIYLSALARTVETSLADVDDALHQRRSLVRVLAMRRTLFVVPVGYLDVVEVSSARSVAANERRKLEGYLAESGVAEPDRWLDEAGVEVEAALAAAGGAGLAARQITAQVPRLGEKLTLGAGSRFEVVTGATSRVLGVLAAEGRIVRGTTAGGWTTRRYQWHRRDHWLGPDAGGPASVTPASASPASASPDDVAVASAALVRRWLAAFGPAPIEDLKWWTGWTVRQIKEALGRLEVVEVGIDGGTGLVLADDLEPEPEVGPWAALLPALDPTPMGWKQRAWYLGPHQPPLFDRSGNIGPTVWADGRIVGGWGQRPDGDVVLGLLEDVGADHRALIDAEAQRLTTLLGGLQVKPAFPTPLQKQLST